MFKRFFKNINQSKIRFEKLSDADEFSRIHAENYENFAIADKPKSEITYKKNIEVGIRLHGKFVVFERNGKITGFCEFDYTSNRSVAKIYYPYVDVQEKTYRQKIQKKMLKRVIRILKRRWISWVIVEFSTDEALIEKVYQSVGFNDAKVIFQSWMGTINPDYGLTVEPYLVRRIKKQDLRESYNWYKRQMDYDSPLYLSLHNYEKIISDSDTLKEGWAIGEYKNKAVGMISSFINTSTNQVHIFGPFTSSEHIDLRIPLVNELFIHYRMKGFYDVQFYRTRPFDNDDELFEKYGMMLDEEIMQMKRKL